MTTPAPVRPFAPTADALRRLWERFDQHRAAFGDELPADPIGFVTWLANESTRVFEIGDPANPAGVFIFTGIVPGEGAWTHVFIWGRDAYPHAAYIESARAVARAMLTGFGLRRLNGLTPVTNVPARVFAERVGFVIEGRLREASTIGGHPTDAWISGLLLSDLAQPGTPESAGRAPATDRMEEAEKASVGGS